ncbi:Ras-GAP domain-containing protein [Entamoeba marina]
MIQITRLSLSRSRSGSHNFTRSSFSSPRSTITSPRSVPYSPRDSYLSPRSGFYGSKNVWADMLLPLVNDIPESVFKSLIHISMDEITIMANTMMIFSFYDSNERLANLMEYIIKREVIENINDVELIFNSSSCFNLMIKTFCKREIGWIFDIISMSVLQKIQKSKFKFINTTKSIQKNMDNFVLLFDLIIKKLMITENYTISVLYFFSQLEQFTRYHYPIDNCIATESILFDLVCDKLNASIIKNSKQKTTVNTFISMTKWFINPKDYDWSEELKMKTVSIRSDFENWRQSLVNIQIQKSEVFIGWKSPLDNFNKLLTDRIEEIKMYVCKASKTLLDIHFTDSHYLKKNFNMILSELDRLQRNDFNENSQVLMQMSKIKLMSKDLKEEIRYLNERLSSTQPLQNNDTHDNISNEINLTN